MSANGANGELVATPSAGTAVRVGFGEQTVTAQAETSSTAVAAQQTAMVQAAFIMAERRPRDIEQVRFVLLKTCKRPRFAAAAMYKKPVGKEKNESTGRWEQKFAEGLSIRFAEEAARNMRNLRIDSYTIYDDPKRKIVKFVVLDLESNTEWSKTVTIEKTTERRELKKGQVALATRINSYGETVYIVDATQEEITKREGAEASKAWRDGILKNMPADIKEECIDAIKKVVADDTATDPEAAKKTILDGFAELGVTPAQLRDYVGHDLATLNPAELNDLRGIFRAIREGETTWGAVMDDHAELLAERAAEAKRAEKEAAKAGAGATAPATGTGKPSLDETVAASRARREAAKGGGSKSETAQKPAEATQKPTETKPATSGDAPAKATAEAVKEIDQLIFDVKTTEVEVLKWYPGVEALKDLTAAQATDAIERLHILDEQSATGSAGQQQPTIDKPAGGGARFSGGK